MKIVILMEDTKGEQEVSAEHGLSLYIETGHHKILADTGASDRTWENAGALGVDLRMWIRCFSVTDTMIIPEVF